MRTIPRLLPAFLLCAAALWLFAGSPKQDWTRTVRIGAYGLRADNADEIVRDATASHVFGIEVDNDIPGRYESFLDPAQKLKDIRALAERAHRAGNKAFVYIAGTECITANADKVAHTLAKDHPDWLQRKLTGEPALFTAGAAFWIAPGDEDVWISPYASEWRKRYMERVRQIAATGIDGIYVDIPYWMTHFDGWEDSWASFDDYTVAAFRAQTGLDARRDLKLGNFEDPNFRRWIDFRIETMTDFVREIGQNAKSVNPQIKTIPEIYPGIEEEAVRVGADVYEMYRVADAIAHEYEYGGGDHTASARTPLDWFFYQVGMHSFRAFAGGKATWILNYSWDGDKNVAAPEAMGMLAMSQVMAGANFWDAKGHQMSRSNDPATRTKIFAWIAQHEDHFYRPRSPISPIGVYFSPATRNYYARDFIASFRGVITLLMQKHWEFQVVTPRTLAQFKGRTLVLPDIRILSPDETAWFKKFADGGGTLLATGAAAGLKQLGEQVTRVADCPGKAYVAALSAGFDKAEPDQQSQFLDELRYQPSLTVEAHPAVVTSIANVNGTPHIYFANFKGIEGGKKVTPTPETNVRVRVKGRGNRVLHLLPFLGEEAILTGTQEGNEVVYTLPRIELGAVAWFNQ